jgi:hypothetical protein
LADLGLITRDLRQQQAHTGQADRKSNQRPKNQMPGSAGYVVDH